MAQSTKGYTRVKSFKEFVEDSRMLLGKPVLNLEELHAGQEMCRNEEQNPWDNGVRYTTMTLNYLRQFVFSLGDDNPLYTDPRYARNTRYGSVICYPSILQAVRYNMWHGANGYATYSTTSLVAGIGWELNDVIRMGDEFVSSYYAAEVLEKKGATGPLCFTYSHAGFWNQFKELVATGRAGNCIIGREEMVESIQKKQGVREMPVYERDVTFYSEDEIKKIVDGIEGEKRRGDVPLYWEDTNVGDKLTPIVKGPMTTSDMMAYDAVMWGNGIPAFELAYWNLKGGGGYRNTRTNWPFDSGGGGHYDWDTCRSRGLPAPFDVGVMRSSMSCHLLQNWMGDDGFIRRLEVQMRKPNYWGDTTFYNAEVVKKYRDKVGDEEYGAVDIRIVGTNQIGEVSTPGIATVYLPSKGEPVKLPVPHEDKYEEYENYIKMCDELRAHWKTNPVWPIEP